MIGGAHSLPVVDTAMARETPERCSTTQVAAGSGRLYLTTSHFRRPPSWRARTDHPDVVYGDSNDVDLGRRVVHIRATDRAHSKGAVRAHITQPPPSHR